MSDSDACAEANLSSGLDSVEFGQDAASIRSQRGQDFTVTARKHTKTQESTPSVVTLTGN